MKDESRPGTYRQSCKLTGYSLPCLAVMLAVSTFDRVSAGAAGAARTSGSVGIVGAAAAEAPLQEHISLDRLIRLPLTRQATDYTCGAAALQSVFAYFGDELREDQLARQLKTNPRAGTRYKEIARLCRARGFTVEIKTGMSAEDLKKWIDQRKPVICLIQAWPDKPVDFRTDWEDGHYVVAVGYDRDNIYFMDPCVIGNYGFIPTAEFLARWHDKDSQEKLVGFGMAVTRDKPVYKPEEIKPIN